MKNNYLTTKNIMIFWVIVIVLGLIIGGLELAIGLLLAAVISTSIMYYQLNTSWEGKIEKIKTETKTIGGTYENEQVEYRDITYAYIRLSNGKKKKIQAQKNWKVGDKIIKEKGKSGPEKTK